MAKDSNNKGKQPPVPSKRTNTSIDHPYHTQLANVPWGKVPQELAYKFNQAMSLLPPRERDFVVAWLRDYNATKAAGLAGYVGSLPQLAARGSQLIRKSNISQAIGYAVEARQTATGLDGTRTLIELMRLSYVDPADIFNPDTNTLLPIEDIPENTRRAIKSIKVFEEYVGKGENREFIGYTKTISFWPKDKALELLGKHQGLFPIHGKLDVNVSGRVEHEVKLDYSKLNGKELKTLRDIIVKATTEVANAA